MLQKQFILDQLKVDSLFERKISEAAITGILQETTISEATSGFGIKRMKDPEGHDCLAFGQFDQGQPCGPTLMFGKHGSMLWGDF